MWTNYHCHTSYCDGKKPVSQVIAEAEKKGMLALGISSHAPLPFERSWCMKNDQLAFYLNDIQTAVVHSNIQLYSGLEIDFIPGKISPATYSQHLDYTVGSVHFVDRFPGNNEGWEIDGSFKLFEDGLNEIFSGDIKKAVSRYYELTREMLITAPPTIVGHMDKIKMHNRDNRYFDEDDDWYREEVLKTLDEIRRQGCIVEVNTRGIYQKKTDATYPSSWVLKEILLRGIPVTLSSDAHHPDDLVNLFPETAKELLKIGFEKIRILLDRKWTDVPFSENGIINYAH